MARTAVHLVKRSVVDNESGLGIIALPFFGLDGRLQQINAVSDHSDDVRPPSNR
jgi:hypothetical protein